MKKLLSIALILVMLTGVSGISALADDTKEMENILLSVKERIGSTDGFKTFNSSVSTYDGKTTYNFDWNTDGDDYKSLGISVSQSGIITRYYYYDSNSYKYDSKATINKITSAEAIEKAKALLDVLNPSLKDKLVLNNNQKTESLYNDGFSFEIKRYENGLPVYGDGGNIYINSTVDKITDFNITYTENLQFEDASSVIDKEKAKSLFGEKLGMQLEYLTAYDNKVRVIYPVYVQKENNGKYISAVTGEIITLSDQNIIYYSGRNEKEMSKNVAYDSGFTPVEIQEIENVSGLMSKDQIVELLKNNKIIVLSPDVTLTNYGTYKDYYSDTYYANLSFSKESENDYKYENYQVDAKTGELVSYYSSKYAKDESKSIGDEKAKEILTNALQSLTSKAGEFKEENYSKGSVTYVRYVNGIPYRDNTISASLNMETGEITSYNLSYTNSQFPSIDGVISKGAAEGKLFEQVDYNLCYIVNKDKAQLVYMIDAAKPAKIDAFTGKLLGYDNKEYIPETKPEYTDISGHYAEEIIKVLSNFGISFEGNEFRPDEAVLQKDFISLIVSVFVSRQPITIKREDNADNAYSQAKRLGIINDDEINPTEVITRELAAKYLIRAMGIESYASLENIYVSPFPDVTEYVGHISILGAMGVFKGDSNGNFNPKQELTRAQAAIVIYNYLSR